MGEERDWAELQKDCLVDIFTRLRTVELVECVQYVCKSWFNATLDPLCWDILILPDNASLQLVEFVVRRSEGLVSKIVVQGSLSEDALIYLCDQCPDTHTLAISHKIIHQNSLLICKLIGKWESLVILQKYVSRSPPVDIPRYGFEHLKETLESISVNCPHFDLLQWSHSIVSDEDVSAIVTYVPNIIGLILCYSKLESDHVVTIMKNCKKLVYLDISYCVGFKVGKKILKLASHINYVNMTGTEYLNYAWERDM